MAEIRLHPDGVFEMSTLPEKGRWKARGDRIDIDIRDQRWRMELQGDIATLERPDIGTRGCAKKPLEAHRAAQRPTKNPWHCFVADTIFFILQSIRF